MNEFKRPVRADVTLWINGQFFQDKLGTSRLQIMLIMSVPDYNKPFVSKESSQKSQTVSPTKIQNRVPDF